MQYRFADKASYEDLAAGRVIRGAPGATNFPVRLASELFQRVLAVRGGDDRVHVYDPCCGSAYLLTTLGFLHGPRISRLTGSDIDPLMVNVARENLTLLGREGLHDRAKELRALHERFGKESHAAALASAGRLGELATASIAPRAFRADATDVAAVRSGIGDRRPDVVVSDFPYGRLKQWSAAEAASGILVGLHDLLADDAVLALVLPRREPLEHPGFARVQRIRIGKREAHLLRRE